MPPVAFLQRPARWLETISRTGATMSGAPNFAYDLCVLCATDEWKARLDLSSWRIAFVGAEPIRPGTLIRFAEAFEPCGFRREAFLPCYPMFGVKPTEPGVPARENPLFSGVFCGAGLFSPRKS
jgi:acyl-CoA synthetase (AMP-forming)/AMP-acid ligase II